jgi:hypothetical protein
LAVGHAPAWASTAPRTANADSKPIRKIRLLTETFIDDNKAWDVGESQRQFKLQPTWSAAAKQKAANVNAWALCLNWKAAQE